MRKRLYFLLCLVALSFCVHAQTQTPTEATGSVSGHVYCADTNQPARFALVILQPAPEKAEAPSSKKFTPGAMGSAPPSVRTGLDGSFRFAKVKPGIYFLITEFAGYVSPLAKLSSEEIRSGKGANAEKIEKLLDKITVAVNKESTSDIELERGAAISGTIRYDDGSPANGLAIALFRQQDDGKLVPISTSLYGEIRDAFASKTEGTQTNDNGHYRIASLPAGKYAVQATFPTETSSFGGIFGGPSVAEIRSDEAGALSVFTGNVFRRKDAKLIELVAGEERDGADITIPLLGLHSLSGSVLALSDSHPINHARVELLYADDKTPIRRIELGDDGRFSFAYIPEGEYILRISDAADTVQETFQDTPHNYRVEDKPVHNYGSAEQPIILHDDVSSLIINVPEKSAPQKQ